MPCRAKRCCHCRTMCCLKNANTKKCKHKKEIVNKLKINVDKRPITR